MRHLVLIASFIVGGCSTLPEAPPSVAGDRPKVYADSDFSCQDEPAPPDRTRRQASPAQKYVDRLAAAGLDCRNKLGSAGRKAGAADIIQ